MNGFICRWLVCCALLLNMHLASPENLRNDRIMIPLPMEVYFEHQAVAGRRAPVYLVTPEANGVVVVTLESHSGLIPNLKVDGCGTQTVLDSNLYEIRFEANAAQTYAVTLNKLLSDSGLYGIVAVEQN